MCINKFRFLTIVAVFVISSFTAQTAFAAPQNKNDGDQGKKAQVVSASQSSKTNHDDDRDNKENKKDKNGTRPGWGHGDKNHDHTGPPGQSVRPKPKHQSGFASSVNIFAEAGSKVVVYIFNGISQMFHFSA